ncbi:MltA-interacting MipA family protein [Shewanella frigidimarina NCIMB 400]|uniref:MltA-interacting MipA family protein n=2 Tax=Shewanellaceae TaxID=267890 RepID=Q07YL2_SHEFN|nr:MltA-interacting MipA family protein [Shewanella frigidimarina NCIMB 400]
MNKMNVILLRSLLLGLLLTPNLVVASDIATSVSRGGESRLADGGYFELGASVYGTNQLDIRQTEHESVQPSLLISGMYQYKGLFIEMIHESQDGINLGLNLWSSPNWSLDFLAANLQSSTSRNPDDAPNTLDEAVRNEYLMSMDSLFIGAGFRATRYWDDDYIFQYRIVSDYFDAQGIASSARLGKSWQVRNWNFHALASIEYASSKLSRRLFGVESSEATELFPEYRPGSAVTYGIELGVAYPLSEKLVFRAMYRLNVLSKEITNSPFNQADYGSFFNASISYVF